MYKNKRQRKSASLKNATEKGLHFFFYWKWENVSRLWPKDTCLGEKWAGMDLDMTRL